MPDSDPSDLILPPVVRTVGGQTYTLAKVPMRDLFAWLAEEKAERRRAAIAAVPPVGTPNVLPVARQAQLAAAHATTMMVEELRPLVLDGPGAVRVTEMAARRAGVPDDQVDALIDSATVAQNLRDGAALSGLFSRADLEAAFPEYAPTPVQELLAALSLAGRADPDRFDAPDRAKLFAAARARVGAAAAAAGHLIDAREADAERRAQPAADPNGQPPEGRAA